MLNLEQARKHVEAAQPGFLYEPRAFWDVGVREIESVLRATRIAFNSDNFYNGSKYPIVLTHITFEPALGLVLDSMAARGLLDGTIRLSSSGNQPVTRQSVPLRTLVSPVASEPPSPYAATPSLVGGFVPQTGIWGPVLGPIWNLSQWHFHHDLIIPQDGAITFSLGNRIDADASNDNGVHISAVFLEGGDSNADFYKGNARNFSVRNQRTTGNTGPWTVPTSGAKAAGVDPVFPPSGVFSGTAYKRQNVTQAGSTALKGFSIMFDQRQWNDVASGFAPSAAVSAYSSRASATPTKAKTVGCGTQESWWRDGAPLSLVSPTRGGALTGKLHVPITLQPGDGLDVEFSFNSAGIIREAGFEITQVEGVSVGLSFTGFAAIEA